MIHFDCDKHWKSHNGNRCQYYSRKKYCTEDGDVGPKWNTKKWGPLEGWSDDEGRTALVCPECGCQEGQGVTLKIFNGNES